MQNHTMADIRCKVSGKAIVIPGGWKYTCPHVYCEDVAAKAYWDYYRQDGLEGREAHQVANEGVQAVFHHGFRQKLKDYLKYWAERYYHRYPEVYRQGRRAGFRRGIGYLEGFDPTLLTHYFAPKPLRYRGSQDCYALLQQMKESLDDGC